MAVVRLPSIHMNSAFPSSSGFPGGKQPQSPFDRQDPRYPHSMKPSQSSTTRSPKLTLKRSHFLPYEDVGISREFHEPRQEQRVYAHGSDAVLSPSQRKRRRGDSDMSMSGRPSDSSSPLGSVQITSASIRALIHDEDDGDHRRSVVYEDSEFDSRASWAASSSRDSGRDSDLWDAATSPRVPDSEPSDDVAGSDPSRPVITNASRNITFDMLQVHFSKPLKDAANYFGVCTTLLKKICRKNGIVSWPYRQIIGLQKSIASMEQQVHYFDGEQRRQYADQLQKLHIKLEAYIRTGEAPSDEELAATLRTSRTGASSFAAASPQPYHQPTSYHPQSVMTSALTLDAGEPQLRYETYAWPSTTTSQSSYDHRQNAQVKLDYAVATQYSPTPLPSIASILKQQTSPHPPQQHGGYAEPRGEDYPPRW